MVQYNVTLTSVLEGRSL
jgi:hypothetical protein